MAAEPKPPHRLRRWATLGSLLVAVFILGVLANHYHLRSPFGPDVGASTIRPQPAEFLYLDTDRVAAYLGQLDGGIAKSERLTEKLSSEDSAKVSGSLFEVGASAQRENFIERHVTPTAAAGFFRLVAFLQEEGKLEDVTTKSLAEFTSLKPGSFVRFHSDDVRTPIYANSYLVVRQASTLKALFPTAEADYYEREQIEAEREDARSYAHQVGPNPRIAFALTPSSRGEKFKILLPLRYRQLTDERSLIKAGGGSFTVVGKLVRMFKEEPEREDGHHPAYIDSPTRETWMKPLEHVPKRLLQYSSRKCKPAKGEVEASERERKHPTLRTCVMSRLRSQTTIPNGGAVILPVAIFK
jgi:hypothetical protein